MSFVVKKEQTTRNTKNTQRTQRFEKGTKIKVTVFNDSSRKDGNTTIMIHRLMGEREKESEKNEEIDGCWKGETDRQLTLKNRFWFRGGQGILPTLPDHKD